jgi:glycosyltransferase involved in cell wall biosynthesis
VPLPSGVGVSEKIGRMAPLVSVIVATYRSGAGLDRLVASLDAQSLGPGELELVAVDDGSGDGTLERLHALAGSRPWMRVSDVPHSGWPCAPRNAGLERASGEYVLFADHDDVLFPESLERAYRFAKEHRADVLNGKELRTEEWFWAWGTYEEDVPEHPAGDVRSILPMTPHKLYRRQFLLDHGIRFIEGSRVLWEDVYFNIDVMVHRPRVATLSSYPVYHWVATGSNSSTSYGKDPTEQWRHIRKVLTHVHQAGLDDASRDWLLTHWYRTRVLSWVGPKMIKRKASTMERGLPLVQQVVDDLLPVRLDDHLGPVDLARAELLRAERIDLLHELAEADQGVTVTPRLVEARWNGRLATLHLQGSLERAGTEVLLRRDGDRLLRALPRELEHALSPTALDVSRWADPVVSVCARGRESRVPWALPTQGAAHVVPAGPGWATLHLTATATLDVDHGLFGRPLDEQMWDFGVRTDLGGLSPSRMLRSAGMPDQLSSSGVFYDNAKDLLSLDLEGSQRGLAAADRLAPPQPGGVAGETVRLRLPQTVLADGDSHPPVEVLAGGVRQPATLVDTPAGASLEFALPKIRGTHRLSLRMAGRTRATRLWLRSEDGRLEMVPEPAKFADGAPASPISKAAQTVADAVPADATQLPTLRSVVGLVGDRLRSRRRG